MTDRDFGYRLARLRDERGLTQQMLADQAGITREYVSMLECGRRTLGRLPTLQALAHSLGIDWRILADAEYPIDLGQVVLGLDHLAITAEAAGTRIVLADRYQQAILRGVGSQARRRAYDLADTLYRYGVRASGHGSP